VADVTYNAIATTETAGEDIPGIRVVKLVSGQIMLADPGDVTEANAVIGVTAGSVTSGNTVKVIRYGPMSDGSWSFTANEKLYLGSSGAITHSVPSSGEVVEIGYAKTSSEIFVNPSSRTTTDNQCRWSFAYGDATPATVAVAKAGKLIQKVRVTITEAFNGSSPSLKVGKSGAIEDLVSTSMIDPTETATYEITPNKKYLSDTNVLLSIAPGSGASAGAGVVEIFFHV
jgi:hypothetical protein